VVTTNDDDPRAHSPVSDEPLQSGVLANPGDELLSEAIRLTLEAAPEARAALFASLAGEIEKSLAETDPERHWTCAVYGGTDGSTVFRGGVGHSLVVDPRGRLWRARSYEDFETTYTITANSCEIATLTPLYAEMREYLPRPKE
jgi:hypothetical protein